MRTFTDGLRSGDWLLVRRATATLVLALSGCAAATLAVGPADPVQRTAIAHAEAWPAAASPAALTSPRTEAAIDDLLGRMTLDLNIRSSSNK